MSRQKVLLEKTIKDDTALNALVKICSNHAFTNTSEERALAINIFQRICERRHDLKIILVNDFRKEMVGVFLVKYSHFDENLYFQKDVQKLEAKEAITTILDDPQTLNYRTVTGYKDFCDEVDVFERFAKLVKDQELVVAYLQAGDYYTVLLLEWINTSLFEVL